MEKFIKRTVALVLAMAIIITTTINMDTINVISAATNTTTTIYFVDNTVEKWVGNDNAIVELVDNTNNHTHYTMTKIDNYVWSAVVPTSAYNLTFNRLNSKGTTQWNSWSAGGRDANNTYYADGAEYGHYGFMENEEDTFTVGDVVYLDITGYTDWTKSSAIMYVNFTDANKKDNDGDNIIIAEADSKFRLLDLMDEEVEENIYKFTVTEEFAGSRVLRFWRGNSTTLWNDSITLTYDDFSDGKNCVVVTGWNESGYLTKYTENSWEDIDTTVDEDKDNVPDYIEDLLGTNTNLDDTDNDGLSDYFEIYVTGTDPIYVDTDENGINDGDEDADADGLTNLEEVAYGTNAASEDTDGDSLTDYDEINVYGTDPLSADTDKDGADDGIEVSMGTDPLIADTSFKVHATSSDTDTVKASVDVELSAGQLASLSVERYEDEFLFPMEIPGYIGGCYEFSVDGSFDEATINFEFNEVLLEDSNFNPVIYYFNESEQELEALDTTVKGNVASATTYHFSKYILLNRIVYEDSFTWQDVWTSSNYTDVEIVLVIDDSGSMTSNDKTNQRLSVAQTLIDNLPKNSKIGVVKFTSSTTCLTSKLTSNKDTSKVDRLQ